MTDQRWRPDMTESPSGGQSSVLCPDGLSVYREILRPHNVRVTIFTVIYRYIPTGTQTTARIANLQQHGNSTRRHLTPHRGVLYSISH